MEGDIETRCQPVLAGVRVLELDSALTPWCCRLLSDLGAEVVLVTDRSTESITAGEGRYFHSNKQIVTIDQGSADGQDDLIRLGGSADVIVMSPTVRTPVWGFDREHETLSWARADAIVCAITPFGISGPAALRPFTHLTAYANSGAMARIGEVGKAPLPIAARMHWHQAAGHAALCVLAALRVRSQVGGQLIDISAQEVEASHELLYERYCFAGSMPGERSTATGIPPTGTWSTADGAIDIAAHQEHHWDAFLEMVGEPEVLAEPSLRDMFLRATLFDGLFGPIAELLVGYNTEELTARGQALGLPICARNEPEVFIDDVQLHARGFLVESGDADTPAFPGAPVRAVPRLYANDRMAPVRLTVEQQRDLWHDGQDPAPRPKSQDDSVALKLPLSGVKVLSLGAFLAGNVCAELLGSLGADVVKVESVSRPEVLRNPAFGFGHPAVEPSGVGTTPMFAVMTRNMRSLALEMGKPEGQAVFRELAADADVVIENFGTGVIDRWGCGFADLEALNPGLVMVSLSGFGRTGPRSGYVAYGSNISNFTGLASRWMTSSNFTDYLTATHTAGAVVAALAAVDAGDGPIYLDAAQIEVFSAAGARLYLDADAADEGVFSHVFPCVGDDRWAAVEVTDLDEWNALCDAVDRADLSATSLDDLAVDQMVEAIESWGATRTPQGVAVQLNYRQIPAAAVANLEDQCRDPQLAWRHFPTSGEHPDLGPLVSRGSPDRLSRTSARFESLGPRFGQHSIEILEEWLGVSEDRVTTLLANDLIFDADRSGPWSRRST